MKAADLAARLERGALLLDGGLGSLLIGMGLEPGQPPDRWNLEHPGRVAEAHRRYVAAGSALIHTNTFGATPPKLEAVGLGGQGRAINEAAVRLARQAAGDLVLVAGDLGPTGRFLPPMGEATVAELQAAFAEQAHVLADQGVDLLSIETMYDLREARAALAAARATGLPVLASMTMDARPRGFFSLMGDPLAGALAALEADGAAAVGFNCSVTSRTMLAMVVEARRAVSVPIVAQPNAGQPRPTADGVVYDADPAAFAADLVQMVRDGARLVGGCCGTDPGFIRAARQALAALDGA